MCDVTLTRLLDCRFASFGDTEILVQRAHSNINITHVPGETAAYCYDCGCSWVHCMVPERIPTVCWAVYLFVCLCVNVTLKAIHVRHGRGVNTGCRAHDIEDQWGLGHLIGDAAAVIPEQLTDLVNHFSGFHVPHASWALHSPWRLSRHNMASCHELRLSLWLMPGRAQRGPVPPQTWVQPRPRLCVRYWSMKKLPGAEPSDLATIYATSMAPPRKFGTA